MRRQTVAYLICSFIGLPGVWAHEKNVVRKPTKADADLKLARQKMDVAKKKLTAKGRYACCIRKSCDLCARNAGSCACAVNIAKGLGACGECFAGWKNGEGILKGVESKTLRIHPSLKQGLPGKEPLPSEIEEARQALNRAKKILVSEKRYSCCIRGGCDECANEAQCPCGGDLEKVLNEKQNAACARKAKVEGQGVCGHCLDGWHGGQGAFPGVAVTQVPLAEMAGEAEMDASMSPGVRASGWYSSGTAQMPRSSPLYMSDKRVGNWNLMAIGQLFALQTVQSGDRGQDRFFSANYIMPMATRRFGRGFLTVRSMFSLEPATVQKGYYPLLFQTGETAKGIPIVDGQHPHDFIMELGASYQYRFSDRVAVNIYGGPRGEPALGPIAFPHRLSASENPLAVLSHHYQDSTHIANNVMTLGVTVGKVTAEASGFNGREPGETRWNLDGGAVNSFSSRITYNPTSRWSMQFSGGRIVSREELHPDVDSNRLSSSVGYFRPFGNGYLATTLIWGQNRDYQPGHHTQTFNSGVAEATVKAGNNWYWTRIESSDKPESIRVGLSIAALDLGEENFARVQAYTLGYERELPRLSPWLSTGLGGQLTLYQTPVEVRPQYGSYPVGAQIFLRFRLAR